MVSKLVPLMETLSCIYLINGFFKSMFVENSNCLLFDSIIDFEFKNVNLNFKNHKKKEFPSILMT